MNKKKKDFTKLDIDKQVDLINRALEQEVYPLLMSHGGGMEILDIEGPKILIRYYGACGGCPIAGTGGTLDFIEYTLQVQIDDRIIVEIIGNDDVESFYG